MNKKKVILSIALLTCTLSVVANPASSAARILLSGKTKFRVLLGAITGFVYYGEYQASPRKLNRELDALFGTVAQGASLMRSGAEWLEEASNEGRRRLAIIENNQISNTTNTDAPHSSTSPIDPQTTTPVGSGPTA